VGGSGSVVGHGGVRGEGGSCILERTMGVQREVAMGVVGDHPASEVSGLG